MPNNGVCAVDLTKVEAITHEDMADFIVLVTGNDVYKVNAHFGDTVKLWKEAKSYD